MLSLNHLIGIASEDTYGEDAFEDSEPAAEDFLAVLGEPEIQETYQNIEPEENTADGFGGQTLRKGDLTEVSFETFLIGKEADPGDPPPVLDVLLKACNFVETVNDTTDVTYALSFGRDQSEVPSMTVFEAIRDDESGDYYTRVVTGVRGSLTIDFSDGQDVRLSFEGTGRFSELSDTTTSISAPDDYSGGKDRLAVQGMTFQLEGDPHGLTAAEVETAMEVTEGRDITADASLDEVGLHLPRGTRPGGSGSWAADEWDEVRERSRPDDHGHPPKGAATIEVADESDTILIEGSGCVVGAYSKSLEGQNYEYETPLTFLDGLSLTFT